MHVTLFKVQILIIRLKIINHCDLYFEPIKLYWLKKFMICCERKFIKKCDMT